MTSILGGGTAMSKGRCWATGTVLREWPGVESLEHQRGGRNRTVSWGRGSLRLGRPRTPRTESHRQREAVGEGGSASHVSENDVPGGRFQSSE